MTFLENEGAQLDGAGNAHGGRERDDAEAAGTAAHAGAVAAAEVTAALLATSRHAPAAEGDDVVPV